MTSAAELAARYQDELCRDLAVPARPVHIVDLPVDADWAASGGKGLTGFADGPPLEVAGAPASVLRAMLAVAAAHGNHPGRMIVPPDGRVLAERAGYWGRSRNAPRSIGGAFRCLPARDGWLGLSLARESDVELVPALICGPVDDQWDAVARWLARTDVAEAERCAVQLGLPAASIPPRPPPERRTPVSVTPGGPRRVVDRPLVVDLSALWAGPLCAQLLGMSGARVVKIESPSRPDGARHGSPEFFAHLHDGHEMRTADLRSDELGGWLDRADVVIESSRPRALQQLGILAEQYVARGAIWVSITAYGRGGDDAMRVGFGDDVAAGAGLVAWTIDGPVPAGDALADPLTGVYAAAAAAIALRGVRGALLDVSMHDVCVRVAGAG